MRITKYTHSCLLVEDDNESGRVGLIDPGIYSYNSGSFDLKNINRLDDILITHEHQDHMYLPFIKEILAKFPNASIITTESAAQQLSGAGISGVVSTTNNFVELFDAEHESMEPLFAVGQNTGVHYLGKVSHPGDSHSFKETKDILALPVTGPWGTVATAAEIGISLKPKYIIPIHDWHLKNEARDGFYGWLEALFTKYEIDFIKPVDGQPFEINL